jgi:ribosomal protein L11 methylase PrmA
MTSVDPGSFRDPSGLVFERDGQIYRQVNRSFAAEWDAFTSSGLGDRLIRKGLLIPHEEVGLSMALDERAYRVIRPRRVDFISYPYEWSFSALKDAALLTLSVQEEALDAGMTLRDASAYNVQFVDGKPILIDTLSFEPGGSSPWAAYGQFCRHFVAPLALMAYRDVRCGLQLRSFIDGIPLDLAAALLPGRTRLRLGLAVHLRAHARAERRVREDQAARAAQARVSKTGQRALVDSLRRTVEGLRWKAPGTAWAGYTTRTSYSAEAAADKARLVREMLVATSGERVWDIGTGTGAFSEMAVSAGKRVIALDADAVLIERLYLASRTGLIHGILPLLMNFTNPSPGLGWAHRERRSLEDRGPAPVVLALAVVHHMAIANNVPLPEVGAFFASLAEELIVEFVPKEDPQTASLLASRPDVFPDYSVEGFREAFGHRFAIVRESAIADSSRSLFVMRRRPG